MKQIILVKYGEIILKGLNRHTFEDLLIRNIKNSIKPLKAKVWRAQATIYVDMENQYDLGIVELQNLIFLSNFLKNHLN